MELKLLYIIARREPNPKYPNDEGRFVNHYLVYSNGPFKNKFFVPKGNSEFSLIKGRKTLQEKKEVFIPSFQFEKAPLIIEKGDYFLPFSNSAKMRFSLIERVLDVQEIVPKDYELEILTKLFPNGVRYIEEKLK